VELSPENKDLGMSNKDIFKVISRDPSTLGGTPVFIGTRVPVQNLLDYLEEGKGLNEFLEDYPTVRKEQVILLLEQIKKGLIADATAA